MKKVTIEPGCITCGTCEYIAPEVFQVTDISRVKKDAELDKNNRCIKDAAQACPVRVITYEE